MKEKCYRKVHYSHAVLGSHRDGNYDEGSMNSGNAGRRPPISLVIIIAVDFYNISV